MSSILWKNFHLCFSKFKCLPAITPPPPPSQSGEDDETQHPLPTSTSIFIKNFNSIYELSSASASASTSTSKSLITSSSTDDLLSSSSDSDADSSQPDFATIFASQRFFFSSPGRSNSIIESADTRQQEPEAPLTGGVAVKKYSPDPYMDFRRSMQEMIEARELTDTRTDWDYLHELLLCYLTLNPKQTHKFIISAFADIIVSLLSTSPPAASNHQQKSKGHHRRQQQRTVSS